jgi:autotransporter-associated beta strand protein
MKSKSILRLSTIALAVACIGSAHAADVSFGSSTPLTFTDTQSYDNGTVDRIGGGTGTVVTFDSGANYTFSGNLTLTGAWNRVTLNSGAALTVDGTLFADVSGVSLNGGTLTTGALRLEDNPGWVGSLGDGKQTVEWGDSVINGATIVANQSNANFISMYNAAGFSSNNLWLNGDGATIDSNGFDIGVTMGMYGNGSLTKTGSGTLTLTAANTFTGNTTIDGGTLKIAEGASIYNGGFNGSAVLTVNNGATLELNRWGYGPGSANQSLGGLDYNPARFVINGGTVKYTGGAAGAPTDPAESPYGPGFTIGALGATLDAAKADDTWTVKYDSRGYGPITSNDGGTLTLTGVGNGVFDKELGGSGGLIKSGSGTWTLARANTYTGTTTVSGGTLSLDTPSLDNASSVIIGSGATLNLGFSGNDIIGGLEINGSGALPPGAYNSGHPTYGSYFTGSGTLLVVTGASGSWTSLADGDWEEPTNWASNTIATGFNQTATFNQATGVTVTLTGNQTIGNLAFDTSDYTLTGASTLTLDSSLTPTISVGADRTATINANLAGTLGLEKTGAGTLVLTASNALSGETVVSNGVLQLGANPASNPQFGALENSYQLTISSGATVRAMGANAFKGWSGGTMDITLNGGTLTINDGLTEGGNHNLGFVTLNGGTLSGVGNANFGGFNLSGPVEVTENSTISATNTNTVGGTRTITVSDGKTLDWSGTITNFAPTNGPSSFIFEGTGTTVFSGINTYTGNTTINEGTLVLADDAQLTFVVTDTNQNLVGGTGTATFRGDFAINTSAVTGTAGGIWLLVDRNALTGESFESTFTVIGFDDSNNDGIWLMTDAKGDWSFDESTGELTLDVGSDYDDWVTANGVTGAENDDDDNDGLTNFEEYAFGLDPTGGSSVNPITAPLDKTTGAFSYTRRLQSLTGLTYSVWTSTDLATWTEDTGATTSQTVTGTVGDVETVQATIPGALPLTAPKLFIQVRAN